MYHLDVRHKYIIESSLPHLLISPPFTSLNPTSTLLITNYLYTFTSRKYPPPRADYFRMEEVYQRPKTDFLCQLIMRYYLFSVSISACYLLL